MRSISLAFACIAAVACGGLFARFGAQVVLGVSVVVAAVVGLAGISRRTDHWVIAVIVCVGLVRGASIDEPLPARVHERGISSAGLRVFEVVDAGEPGPRCRIVLRDGDSKTIEVSAPPEVCPCWRGQRIAISTATLSPSWTTSIHDDEWFRSGVDFDLGDGPVVFRRSSTRAWWSRPLDAYWRWVAHLRQAGWEASRGDDAASMVVAVGLGSRSALSPERREHLRASGLGHLIAVSGLNVAIAAVWLQFVARRGASLIGISPGRACVLAWLPLWIYVGLTGGAASAVRAAIMLTTVDLGTVLGRPTHGPTTLSIVAAAMLLWEPAWLFDPGFVLSVAAMAVIVSAPRELGVWATSWRISCVTAPPSVLFFDVAPLHGLLGNAIALPLFGLLMPVALVACVVPGTVGALALSAGRLFATPILDAAELLAAVPGVGPLGLLVGGVIGSFAWLLRPGPRLEIWLPPKLACGLAIVLSASLLIGAMRTDDPAPPFDWIAVGSVHSRSLLVADPSMPASACLYRPTNGAAMWRWLLEQHGVARLRRLDADLPDPKTPQSPRDDPGTRALALELDRAGIDVDGATDGCRPPTPEQVRAALRSCRSLQGGRGPALAHVWAGGLRCRIEDRWVGVDDGSW